MGDTESRVNPFITNPFYSRGTFSVGCGPTPTIEVIFFRRQYPNPTPSPDWNCQWGLSGGWSPYYTRAMSEHRCFQYSYNAFQARDRRDKSECDSAVYWASMEHMVAIWSFSIFNTKNTPKYQNFYLATQMEHDQSSCFCRGPDDFCWGPASVGPTLVTGPPQPPLE